MARCDNCGHQVDDNAPICPWCGRVDPGAGTRERDRAAAPWLAIGAVVLVIFSMVVASEGSGGKSVVEQGKFSTNSDEAKPNPNILPSNELPESSHPRPQPPPAPNLSIPSEPPSQVPPASFSPPPSTSRPRPPPAQSPPTPSAPTSLLPHPPRSTTPSTPSRSLQEVSLEVVGSRPNEIVYVTLMLVGPGTNIRACRDAQCYQQQVAVEAVQVRERLPVGAAFSFSSRASQTGSAFFKLPRSIYLGGRRYQFGGPNFRIAISTSTVRRAHVIVVPDYGTRNYIRLRA